MVDVNHQDRTIKLKLVYYGPAVGGKTTNLKVLHESALGVRRGQFVSVNSAQDRTILCDLLPLASGGFRGYALKLQLLAVPGQAMYAATRRVVVKNADGVAFVANSAADRWQENVQCLREMVVNLKAQQLDPTTIPLVFQYNKRDLPDVVALDALSGALNGRRAPEFPGVATHGEGVLETFSSLLTLTIQDVCRQYPALQLPPGQEVETWVVEAVRGMFGRSRLDGPAPEPQTVDPGDLGLEPEAGPDLTMLPGHLKVKIPTPEEAPRPGAAPVDVRSPESLAESYAEASAELGLIVDDLRTERDLARTRLEEVRTALELGTEAMRDADIEERVRRILKVLVKAAGADGASLLLASGDLLKVLPLPPLLDDPLSQTVWGGDHVEELWQIPEPRVEEASESSQLAAALRASVPPFEAVGAVPLRSAERLLGLSLLYFGSHAILPTREVLLHLGFLARVLAGPLEASAAREATSHAERLRVLSRPSAAAVASLLTRLPVESARKMRLQLSDALGPLRAPGVLLEIPEGAPDVLGDAPLLRFALATLVGQCEADALERGRVPEVVVNVVAAEGGVHVQVSGGGQASVMTSASQPGPDLADAELSVVSAIVALHGGVLTAGRTESQVPLFTLELVPA
jgi:signal recognition particle receptor subunit beta